MTLQTPVQHIILEHKSGQMQLGGHLTNRLAAYKMDTVALPPGLYQDVRDDLSTHSPVPVTRVALRKTAHAYVGVIDSDGTPMFFALNSRGLLLRDAQDAEKAWSMFDSLMDEEHKAARAKRRAEATDEQEELNEALAEPALVIKAVRRVKNPGKKGAKWFFDKKGQVRYGDQMVPHAKVAVQVSDKHEHKLDKDDHQVVFDSLDALRAKPPKSLEHAHKIIHKVAKRHFDSDTENVANGVLSHLHEHQAIALDHAPEVEEEEQEIFWEKRKAKAKPELPPPFPAKGTQLLINGKPTKLSPDAEHACHTYAKRFIVAGGKVKNQGAFKKNFERSLKALGVPKGDYDYKQFVQRVLKEGPAEKKRSGKKELETAKSHPHLFVDQDGDSTRVMFGRVPAGGFYTGKDNYGAWVRPLREEDLILNVTEGGAPKGWKGKTMSDPSKDFYVTWDHPVSGEKGYIYLSRAAADTKKFHAASVLGDALPDIQAQVAKDIQKSSSPVTKMAAICTMLMDQEHFRVGEEEHAKGGTYGVASFLAGHVKIDGKHVIFEFTGKKEEPWKRMVDFTHAPEALAFIRKCVQGKAYDERLWEGRDWSATSKDVNAYLSQFSRKGVKITAKMFRTFHANEYMRTMLDKAAQVEKTLKLTPVDMKKLYRGFDVKDKAGKKLLAMKFKGQTLQDYFGFEHNTGAKGVGKVTTGILPTIAARLGHTIGACRNNYIDPVLVTRFSADRGWDERTPKEKRSREDLPGFAQDEE